VQKIVVMLGVYRSLLVSYITQNEETTEKVIGQNSIFAIDGFFINVTGY